MEIAAWMISCPQREGARRRTLESWALGDWGRAPQVALDHGRHENPVAGITAAWRELLRRALEDDAELFLFLEDDVEPNLHLRHNLERWTPLARADGRRPLFASLYRCNQPLLWRNERERYLVGAPEAAWGAQGRIMSRATVRYVLQRWEEVDVPHQDLRVAVLAGRLSQIYYHAPSLVQHRAEPSTWGNSHHQAVDFDLTWKAGPPGPADWGRPLARGPATEPAHPDVPPPTFSGLS